LALKPQPIEIAIAEAESLIDDIRTFFRRRTPARSRELLCSLFILYPTCPRVHHGPL